MLKQYSKMLILLYQDDEHMVFTVKFFQSALYLKIFTVKFEGRGRSSEPMLFDSPHHSHELSPAPYQVLNLTLGKSLGVERNL